MIPTWIGAWINDHPLQLIFNCLILICVTQNFSWDSKINSLIDKMQAAQVGLGELLDEFKRLKS